MKRRLKFAFKIILLANISMLQAQKKPNIIVFMVDDMGWQDTSYLFDSALSAYNKSIARQIWRNWLKWVLPLQTLIVHRSVRHHA